MAALRPLGPLPMMAALVIPLRLYPVAMKNFDAPIPS
jgi:hypothetical protein